MVVFIQQKLRVEYSSENNDNLKKQKNDCPCTSIFKVFLVAGGGNYDRSAEMLIAGSSSWVVTGYLPMSGGGEGIRGISFQNRVIMTGMD